MRWGHDPTTFHYVFFTIPGPWTLVFDSTIPPHMADSKFHQKIPIFTPFSLLKAWIVEALVIGRLGQLLVLIFGIIIWICTSMNENFSIVHLVYGFIMFIIISTKPPPWLPLFELELHPTVPNLGYGTRPMNLCVQKTFI